MFEVAKKVYPYPTLAFNLGTGEVISSGMEQFDMKSMTIYDYRSKFPGSRKYFEEPSTGMVVAGTADSDVDAQLSAIFTTMMDKAGLSDVYLSVRNTVLAQFRGSIYLLYYSEPLGIAGMLYSEYFIQHPTVIREEEFNRLIDAKVVQAAEAKGNMTDIAEGNRAFMQIMVKANTTLKPAIPPYVLMCATLASKYNNELSYFDKRLRCDKCVLPVINHLDADRAKTIFDYLSLANVKNDAVSKRAISSFGTLNANEGYLDTLPVSVDSFRGQKLS